MTSEGWYRSGFVYLLANIAVAAVNFGLIPFLIAYLSPAEYGKVGLFSLLTTIFSTFIGLESLSALTRKIYDDKSSVEYRARLTSTCLAIAFVSALLLAGAGAIALHLAPGFRSYVATDDLLWMAALSALLINIMRTRQVNWQVDGKIINFASTQVLNALLAALLTVVFMLYVMPTATARILGIAIAASLLAAYGLLSLYRDGYLGWQYLNGAKGRSLMSYGIPLMPHSAGLFLISSFDRTFVAGYLSISQFGVYLLATQFGSAISLFLDGINNALVPQIFSKLHGSGSADQSRKRLRGLLRKAFLFPVVMVVLAAGVSRIVLSIFAGPYSAAAPPAVAIVLASSMLAPIYVFSNIALFHNRTKQLSLITTISGTANLILVVLLTKIFGINGAAASTAIASGVRLALLYWMVR